MIKDYSPGKWHHENIPFSKFKVKGNCVLNSFVIQLAAHGKGAQVFTIDNFEINNNKRNSQSENTDKSVSLKNSRINSASRPLAVVTQAGRPVIDGRLDDSCLKKSIQLAVVPNRAKEKITDNTAFFLTYDNEKLYIGAKVKQAYLDPVLNLLDKVETKAKSRDSHVYNDDSVEIFLSPYGSGAYYQFVVNMAGVIYDAKNKSADWNGNIVVKTGKGHKSWTLEVAIPFKDLGIKKIEGQKWSANFCRNNPQRNETSAWSPTEGYFHKQKYFGLIRFAKKASVIKFKKYILKKQLVKADIGFIKSGKILVEGADNLDSLPHTKNGNIQLTMKSRADGMGQFVFKQQGSDIARSPLFKIKNVSQNVLFDISCPDAEMTLYVNNQKIIKANNQIKKTIDLPRKINSVALKISGKDLAKISGCFSQGKIKYSLQNCLYSSTLHKGWYKANFDDSRWNLFKKFPEAKQLFLRCKFINNNCYFAPQLENDTMYLLDNTAQKLSVRLTSPFKNSLSNYQQHLMLPKKVKIPVYDFSNRLYKRYKNVLSNTQDNNYINYCFKFSKPVKKLVYNWGFNCISVLVKSDYSNKESIQKEAYSWITGRGVFGLPRKFNIRVMPAPQGCQPENAKIVLHTGFRNKILSTAEYSRLLPGWKKVGINLIGDLYQERGIWFKSIEQFVTSCRNNNIDVYTFIFGSRCNGFMDILNDNPNAAAVTALKKYHNFEKPFCPLFFISNQRISNRIGKISKLVYGISDDIEAGVKTSCFCPKCREYFSKRNNVKRILTTKEILNSYKDQWLAHKLQMNLKVCQFIFDSARKTNPSIISMFYSGYASCPPSQYGVDWKMYKGKSDMPFAGYSESLAIIKETRDELGGQRIIPGILLDSNLWEHQYADQDIKARLWKIFIAGGCVGVNIWNWYDLDGRGLKAISEFSRGVAKFEKFFDEKNEVDIKGIDPSVCKVYKLGDDYIYVAMNHGISALKFTIKLPEKATRYTAFNYYQGQKFNIDKTLATNIPPKDVLLLHITKSN